VQHLKSCPARRPLEQAKAEDAAPWST